MGTDTPIPIYFRNRRGEQMIYFFMALVFLELEHQALSVICMAVFLVQALLFLIGIFNKKG